MSFLNPAGLLLLLLIPLLILLQLFRAARREVDVAVLRFWVSGTEEHTRSVRLHQRILWTPSLLLQLLAVVLASLAIAEPVVTAERQGWARSILIVDNSASMSATDVAGNRLEALRREVEAFLAQLNRGQEAMIVEAGRHPSVKVPFTGDARELTAGLREIGIFAGVANVEEALRLASELAEDDPPADIHLFTDAAYAPPRLPSSTTPVVWHVVGSDSNNAGITAFQIRADIGTESGYEAFIALSNVSDAAKDLTLRVAIEDRVFYKERIVLPARRQRSYIIPIAYKGAGVVRAEIDPRDDLAVDDVAYSVLPDMRGRRVVLVSRGNFFLENALRSDPYLDVVSIQPEHFSPASAKADVVILDRVPVREVSSGNYLLIQSLPANVPITATKEVDFPKVVDWDREHPIGRYLDLSNLLIKKAVGVRPEGDCAAIVAARETPLIAACSYKGRRIVFVGFDLLQSEIPLRAALPILVTNIVDWLSPSSLENRPQHLRAGERFIAQVDPAVTAAEVRMPDGSREAVRVSDGTFSFDQTLQAGLYTVPLGADQRNFAVDLLDQAETNILPRRGMEASPSLSGPVRRYSHRQELWWYLALLALLAMAVEAALAISNQLARPPWPSLLLRGVALMALASALARPTIATKSDATSVAFLLDMSDSIAPAARQDAYHAIEAAVAEKGNHDEVEVIAFAGDARRIDLLATGNRGEQALPLSDTKSTDIAQAISLALATLPKDSDRQIVLMSDGNENSRSAAELAMQARREHAPIFTIPVRELGAPAIVLKRIELPLEVYQGEPFSARVVIWSSRTPKADLELLRGGKPIASATVQLQDGENVFTYRDASNDEGMHLYEARIAVTDEKGAEQDTGQIGAHCQRQTARPLRRWRTRAREESHSGTQPAALCGRCDISGRLPQRGSEAR